MRFRKIDDLTRGDHWHLTEDDECYYAWEYTSGTVEGYHYSPDNSHIMNLKKHPKHRDNPQVWRYKLKAIRKSAQFIGSAINHDWLRGAVLIPVPPSKAKDHPEFDDRMLHVCQQIPVDFDLDVRELVYQNCSLHASHNEGDRHAPEDLLRVYEIDESLINPPPSRIAIVDDVLTTGSHFKAAKRLLMERFPRAQIIGCFIARRTFPS